MNPLGVKPRKELLVVLLLCMSAKGFPTEGTSTAAPAASSAPNTADTEEPTFTLPSTAKAHQPANAPSISTTSSLLFKDKKPILTYLLGQPKKQGGVSSPAQLLSPDRYEFFTFDDDGQIVKKLMSVKEIQKIIANNEKGSAEEHGTPIEYYQILTVTPDVESIPSVSRINPNEPLFSIHDVIASVQNVLKSEMKTKQSNATNYVASASSDHFEILTEQPPFTFKVELQKSTTAPQTTPSPSTFTLRQDSEEARVTTEQPENTATSTAAEPVVTHIPVLLVTTETQKSSSPKETIDVAASTHKVANDGAQIAESKPLSLSDAHPGFLSNDSFLDMKPITVQEMPHIAEALVQELKPNPSTENFVKVETVERHAETSTPSIDIPITSDLAESVSSVLWQIASENSMLSELSAPTEAVAISTDGSSKQTDAKTFQTPTTETPVQRRSTVKEEKLSESPLIALSNILIPQNRPRPFEKIQLIEKDTPDDVESRIEPLPPLASDTTLAPSTPNITLSPSTPSSLLPPLSTVVILTEKETNQSKELENSTNPNSITPQVVSVSPDAVDQSPEHVKPQTERVVVILTTQQPSAQNESIEGIQVIQEANIGKIPRTTEFPGQAVKEIERMEISMTEETLQDSASNAFSTQLPYKEPEFTTVAEEQTETTTEADSAEVNTEPVEVKSADASDRIDITFIPMVIKTPAVFKQEETLKEGTTTEGSTEQIEVTEWSTTANDDSFESKELPESTLEVRLEPKTTTEAIQKETLDDDAASLKQNLPSKPHFGKPQKPTYSKPAKPKPQTESKTQKPAFVRPKEPDTKRPYENHLQSSPSVLELDAAPEENLGLEATVANLDGDVKRFADLCNELAFSLWSSVTHNGLSFVRSMVVSPFAVTSLLAMVFLGARGPTSGQMNDILKLDDMVTFNPHLVFRNVTESLVISRNPGVATAAFVRELYSDKSKGKLLDFYKERVQQFYDGHVEEVNFKTVGDTLRRQTNHLVKRQTWGKITDFLRGSNLMPRPPLAAFSANIFQTDCTWASTKDRDGEMYFVILPASRLRRLVPIPAVVWRDSFLAGYEPNLDATAVSISPSDSAISTIFVLPGQQGLIAPGDTLARLEHHLLGSPFKKGHWSRLMRCLLPRPGLELQIPRLSHKSVINVTSSLQRMGLKDLFSADKADLTGLNGLANDLHLSDMLQVNLFSTCGEEPIGSRHHSEVYPATPILRREKSSDNVFSDSVDNLFAVSDFEDPAISALPLELRPRQARVPLSAPGVRVPEPPRLRFDRPFLFFVRHNPTGLILHMGRFNPRLMP